MEPMQILARSSIPRVLRRPKVAPVRRLSPSLSTSLLCSALPRSRWWRPAPARRHASLMAAPNPIVRHEFPVFSYGSRNMASRSRAKGQVLGKPGRCLLIPSAKDTMVPPREHFAVPSAKEVMVAPDENCVRKSTACYGSDHPASGEDERRARMDIISGQEVASRTTVERTDGKHLSDDETHPNWSTARSCYASYYIDDDVAPMFTLPNSCHRDGSIYRGKDRWKTDYCVADRSERLASRQWRYQFPPKIAKDCVEAMVENTRFEAMALSVPTADCYIRNGFCMLHTPKAMLQIFSLKLAKIPVNGPVELYGYIATRDGLDPLLNYVVKFSRDDPIIMEQGSLISLAGPKRGIEMYNTVLIEYDMRIKTGKDEKDDLRLIDGVSLISNAGFSRKVFTNRISGNCGAVDIGVSRIDCAVEATVEVFISKVQSSFSLCLGCFTGGFKDEIRLFDGIIGEPRGLKRSVVAVMTRSSLDLKFKIGSGSHGCTEHCCSFKANNHGCVVQPVKTKFASVSVKVTWSTLPFTLAGLNLA
ncbi:hypothetical protein ACP70R_029606 [Stipagrostis hirtigluma subsp. patula]